MQAELDQLVRERAKNRCEYCHLPQSVSKLKFPIDHIIARQHGGAESETNLALCCGRCNQHKGPNIAGIDPVTGNLSRLFNPRTDNWHLHFRYDGAVLKGLTEIGRTTIGVLSINDPSWINVREALLAADLFPEK